MPMILLAEVTTGKVVTDSPESRDDGERVDRPFTNVLVAWVGTDRDVVRLELLKPTGVAIVCWMEVYSDGELGALDSIGEET